MTFDQTSAVHGTDSPALMTVTFRVHRFEPFDQRNGAQSAPAQNTSAQNRPDSATQPPASHGADAARPRRHHSSPFAKIDAKREHNDENAAGAADGTNAAGASAVAGRASSAAATPSAPRATARPPRRTHTSPFAKIDAQRERESTAGPARTTGITSADTANTTDDGAPRRASKTRSHGHSSPFARIDARRAASSRDASQGTEPTTAPSASRMHRTMRPTRRAASTLGGAPVAGGFGASDAGRSWTQDYTLTVDPRTTVLDCLLLIKRTQDPTLAFRYSCGHGMCGSDAVAINGTPSLLCKTTVQQAAQTAKPATPSFRRTAGAQTAATSATAATTPATTPASATSTASEASTGTMNAPVIDLAPIAAFSVQRDLIADIDPMLDQIRALQPYLQARGDLAMTADGKVNVFEYLQSPEQLAKFEQLTTCIACGVCEASCPVFVGGDAFVGPAALVNQIRFIDDSRDGAAGERLAAISESDGLPACQSVRACGLNCPQGIDVGEVIWQFIQGVQTRKQEG